MGDSNFAASAHFLARGGFCLGAFVGGLLTCYEEGRKERKRRKKKHISVGRILSEQDSVGADLTDSV